MNTTPEHRIRLAAAAARGRDLSTLRRRLDVGEGRPDDRSAHAEGVVSAAPINAHAHAERFRLSDEKPCDCAETGQVAEIDATVSELDNQRMDPTALRALAAGALAAAAWLDDVQGTVAVAART